MSSPTRRREDMNLIRYAHQLFGGEIIHILNRWLAFSYGIGAMIWGGGLIFRNGHRAYQNPVFDGIFRFAPPTTWGLAWWGVGLLLLLTAFTGRAILFLWALTCTAGVLTGWVVGVVAETIVADDAVLTTGAIALYQFAYTGLAAMALSPKPLEREVEIFQRDESGVIVPLRPIDRRTG